MESWLNEVLEKAQKRGGSQVVATGITPSGPYHLGHLREVVVGNAIFQALKEEGLDAQLIYIVDDFDHLRKLYPFLPDSFTKYIGQPLSRIPAPDEKFKGSYADYYLEPFLKVLKELDINPKIYRATEIYEKGLLKETIKIALEKKEKIRKVLEKVSGHKLSSNWSPYRPWCKKCQRIDQEVEILEEDLKNYRVKYRCSCGHEGVSDFSKGEGKLQWRVHWPAHWFIFGVTVEPSGKDHMAAGGSYDTASIISKEIFGYEPPIGVPYEFLYLKGVKGKMSSSLGNVLAAEESLKILSPELIKKLLLGNISRHLSFDPSLGVVQLWEESGFPFKHLVTIIQASQGDFAEIKRLLKQSGHENLVKDEPLLKENIERAKYWLENFAPDQFKFELQEELPKDLRISPKQKELLGKIAEFVEQGLEGEALHNKIYETGKTLGLSPRETFEPIYLNLLGKTSGPKAGWFLSLLDKDFVSKRFKGN